MQYEKHEEGLDEENDTVMGSTSVREDGHMQHPKR